MTMNETTMKEMSLTIQTTSATNEMTPTKINECDGGGGVERRDRGLCVKERDCVRADKVERERENGRLGRKRDIRSAFIN